MQSRDDARRGRLARRIVITLLALFVLAGLLNVFGHRNGTATSSTESWELVVTHPSVTRGGLAANFSMELRRVDGEDLPAELEIRSNAGYFSIFDENGLDPQPASSWIDGDDLVWTFEPPVGSASLVVDLDARMQPNARWSHDGRSTVVVAGEPVVSVEYDTWVVP